MKNLVCLSFLSLAPIFTISASDQQKIVCFKWQPKHSDQAIFIVKNSMKKADCEKDCPNQGTLYSDPEKECYTARAIIKGSSRRMEYMVHITQNAETKKWENVSVINWRCY
jgi:hypothetical protein